MRVSKGSKLRIAAYISRPFPAGAPLLRTFLIYLGATAAFVAAQQHQATLVSRTRPYECWNSADPRQRIVLEFLEHAFAADRCFEHDAPR